MGHILFSHSSVDWPLDSSYFEAIMNNTALNIHVHVFVLTCIFISVWYLPKSEISGSCG